MTLVWLRMNMNVIQIDASAHPSIKLLSVNSKFNLTSRLIQYESHSIQVTLKYQKKLFIN